MLVCDKQRGILIYICKAEVYAIYGKPSIQIYIYVNIYMYMHMLIHIIYVYNRLPLRNATGAVDNFGFRVTFSSTLD